MSSFGSWQTGVHLSGCFGAEIQTISWTGPGFGMNAGLLRFGYFEKYEQNMNMPEIVFLNNIYQNILKNTYIIALEKWRKYAIFQGGRVEMICSPLRALTLAF